MDSARSETTPGNVTDVKVELNTVTGGMSACALDAVLPDTSPTDWTDDSIEEKVPDVSRLASSGAISTELTEDSRVAPDSVVELVYDESAKEGARRGWPEL